MRADRPPPLSPRQTRVLALHAQGLVDKEIAALLGVSVRTVRGHFYEAMHRLDARTRAAAVLAAVRSGALSLDGERPEVTGPLQPGPPPADAH